MSQITVSQHPVLQLDLPGYSVLPVTLPLNTQGEGSGYIDNPIGGPLKLDLGPLAPIQYPNQGEEARGPQGPMGQTGPRGPRGLQGNGKSAYQIWLEAGNVGSVYDFLASLGYGVDLGSLIDLIRGPLDAELGERLSEQDLKILQAQMAADARLYEAEVAIHDANTNTANAIAAEALARADALIALHGELESAIIAESVTRSNEDESYASQTNLLFAQFDTDLRALVSQEASARATADQANAEQINLVNSRLDSGGDIATAMSTLQTNITNTNGQVSILSQSIDQVQANLSSATSSLQASYDSLSGKYNASHTVTLSVDGHVSGTRSENDGSTSRFSILATVFQVISSASTGLEWRDGYLRAYTGAIQLIFGINFGASGNLCFWYGANLGANGATKSNATIWFDNAGNAYFGGTLSAGILKNSAQTTVLTSNPSIEVGPFTTNGHTKTVTVSYSASGPTYRNYFNGMGSGTYPPAPADLETSATTLRLYRSYDNGANTLISSSQISHSPVVVNEFYVERDAFDPNLPNGGWIQEYYYASGASMTFSDTLVGMSTFKYIASAESGVFQRNHQSLSVISVE